MNKYLSTFVSLLMPDEEQKFDADGDPITDLNRDEDDAED